jgi:hypothetical protein
MNSIKMALQTSFFFFLGIITCLPLATYSAFTHEIPEDKYAEFPSTKVRELLAPYIISSTHPMKKVLDQIFKNQRVIQDPDTFAKAGFNTFRVQPQSFIRVAKHHLLPGYLVKVYLDSEVRTKDNRPSWLWFMYRAKGARQIQALIEKKGLRYITVPNKYIYMLPKTPIDPQTGCYTKHPAILLVEKKNIQSQTKTIEAWKNKVTTRHIDELFCIMQHGYASTYIDNNIPYCGNGIFSCIDTEKPKRVHDLNRLKRFLNPTMREYWDWLIANGGNIK